MHACTHTTNTQIFSKPYLESSPGTACTVFSVRCECISLTQCGLMHTGQELCMGVVFKVPLNTHKNESSNVHAIRVQHSIPHGYPFRLLNQMSYTRHFEAVLKALSAKHSLHRVFSLLASYCCTLLASL